MQAQEPTVETRIERVRGAFAELDASAAACLSGLESMPQGQTDSPCSEFLELIDGPMVADYLADCRALKDWREAFITAANTGADAPDDAPRQLRRLMDIEYFCGEAALSRRTEHVQAAFNRLRTSEPVEGLTTERRYSEQLTDSELRRQRLQNERALREQRRRLGAETQNLWQDLELELLRQRLESQRSNDFQGP